MIPPREILGYVRAVPFRPFRIQMASGQAFDIRHPRMVRVGRETLIIFTFVRGNLDVFDRWETASLELIENITLSEELAA